MAIDVLSDPDFAPIIVGAEADLFALHSVNAEASGLYHLVLDGQQVALSAPASRNFQGKAYILLVEIAGETMTRARRVRTDDFGNGHDLSQDQCRDLASALSLSSEGGSWAFHEADLARFRSRHPDLAAA